MDNEIVKRLDAIEKKLSELEQLLQKHAYPAPYPVPYPVYPNYPAPYPKPLEIWCSTSTTLGRRIGNGA